MCIMRTSYFTYFLEITLSDIFVYGNNERDHHGSYMKIKQLWWGNEWGEQCNLSFEQSVFFKV